MFKIITPHFFQLTRFNQYLAFIKRDREYWLKDNTIDFIYTDGNFPYAISAGKAYCNKDKLTALYHDLSNLCNTYNAININLIFDFTNLLLTEDQLLNDNYLELILSLNNNGANLIKVSNLTVKNILSSKYPYYNYVFEDKGLLSIETLNEILSDPKIDLVYLHPNFKLEDINQLNNRKKLVYTINNRCKDCDKYLQCHLLDSKNVQEFSENSVFDNCENKKFKLNCMSLEEIRSLLKFTGIQYLRFDDFYHDCSEMDILLILIKFFIKPEFYVEAFKEF